MIIEFCFFCFACRIPFSGSRECRNKAEKNRRDKMNSNVKEMGAINPLVVNAPKRVDKTSTLRLSAGFIRLHESKSLITRSRGGTPTVSSTCRFSVPETDSRSCNFANSSASATVTLCLFQ